MFEDATAGTPVVDPGQYLAKVVRLEEGETGEFGPSIKWVFNLADAKTREPMYDEQGELFEFYAYSSTKMGPRAKARQWAEALLGREIQNGESGAEIAEAVVGRTALVLIGNNEKEFSRILQMAPAKGNGAKAPAKAAAKPKAAAAVAAADGEDDEYDPFSE
ncbi:MAG TPA: hypothetical protein VF187_07310 [Gemmatimonadales bacterium]